MIGKNKRLSRMAALADYPGNLFEKAFAFKL